MIYTIRNHQIVPLVDRNGKHYRSETKHAKHVRSQRSKRWHKYYNFYNSNAWYRKSRQVRKREPLCRACVKERNKGERPLEKVHLSSSVDHIVPLKVDWSKRLDDGNLQPLCSYHHKLKNLVDHPRKPAE